MLRTRRFRAAAKGNKYKATGLFFDVGTIPPGTNEKSDAVAIALDHKDNYSVIVYFPYKLKIRQGRIWPSVRHGWRKRHL